MGTQKTPRRNFFGNASATIIHFSFVNNSYKIQKFGKFAEKLKTNRALLKKTGAHNMFFCSRHQ